jgi:hypothetical protein
MLIHLMYMVNRITNYKNGLRISWLTTIIFSILGLLIHLITKECYNSIQSLYMLKMYNNATIQNQHYKFYASERI